MDSFARSIAVPIRPASQMARQADGITPLEVVGEVHCELLRGTYRFTLDALVVKQLDVDVLAGNPFLVLNDIAVRPARSQIVVGDEDVVHYGPQPLKTAAIRRTQAHVLHCPPSQTVLLPGDYVELKTPIEEVADTEWALEPRIGSPANKNTAYGQMWPAVQEVQSIAHTIRLTNDTSEPIMLKKNEHICQIRPISTLPIGESPAPGALTGPTRPRLSAPFSSQVSVDPDRSLTPEIKAKFVAVNLKYDSIFQPRVSKYNGASGKIEATVNMGPTLPPQRKGRLPHCNRDQLDRLQQKFDELEEEGVFAKPEDAKVSVEYLNMSFLVKKSSGGDRLVTSFGEVGKYSKPQPSLMPSVDGVLRDIARWKFVVITDLRQSFYQIPLSHSSMKYCGVVTTYKGIRVYTRSAMGMPGSETCLEELMCRVLGGLIQEGCTAKIANDLYVGGDTLEDLLYN